MASPLIPVALFVYNRLDYTRRTVEALRLNEGAERTPLLVYADGPKHEGDPDVRAVREYVSQISGFASVELHFSEQNKGLRFSLIAGIDATLRQYERIIVLEDDIISGPYFLRYMNDALEMYANDAQVAAINSNAFFEDPSLPETFFLRHTHCLGWGTWRRAWAGLNRDATALQMEVQARGLEKDMNWYGPYPNWATMLAAESMTPGGSWAILWHTSNFLLGRLSLWPRRSFTKHIGFPKGTHHAATFDEWENIIPRTDPLPLRRVPVEEPAELREKISALWKEHKRGVAQRALRLKLRSNVLKNLGYERA